MRVLPAALLLALACGGASAQPTPVPTPSGAGAVTPSDQVAVQPALPDERANRNVALGTSPPTPAPLVPATAPATAGPAPAATPAAGEEAPGRSEPNTGTSPAAAGSVHRKPSVSGGRPVTVSKESPLTVVAYEPGKTLTLRRPEGTAVTYPLAKKADVPAGLAPGRSVTIRTKTEHGRKVVSRVRVASDVPVLSNVN